MPDAPLFSIVTPSYNQAEYLEQTICSVLDQDYPNLEYLVVDGASTDGSVEIIRKYASRLAWWVSERDHGQAEAINKGLSRARGEYVAWVNSDDLYLPGTLTAAAAALAAHPDAAFVFGNVQSIDAAGEVTNLMRYGHYTLADLMCFNIVGQPGVFMRRPVLEQAGLLDENFHMLLDHHLWLRMARLAPIYYVNQTWAAARFHAAAKNVAQAPAFGREAYQVVDWLQAQPDFAADFRKNRRRIWAGAYRMNGRYLLDGGLPGPALKAYLRGLWMHPATVLPEWRRVAFAAASLLFNVSRLRDAYLERRKRSLPRDF